MSVLWEREVDGTAYSVRNHGATVRLYSNGVFHSQWNPDRPFTGGVWDCLSLPALHIGELLQAPRILLLGTGGGAVIRQLDTLIDFAELIAVEIDPVHLTVARRWFGVSDRRVTLVQADAIDWVQRYAGEPFDLVIDDLFGHADHEPLRAAPLTDHWIRSLRTLLQPRGLLVVNCVDGRELKRAVPALADAGFQSGYCWTLPGYTNAIAVVSNGELHSRAWSRALEASDLPAPQQRQARIIQRRPLRGLLRN